MALKVKFFPPPPPIYKKLSYPALDVPLNIFPCQDTAEVLQWAGGGDAGLRGTQALWRQGCVFRGTWEVYILLADVPGVARGILETLLKIQILKKKKFNLKKIDVTHQKFQPILSIRFASYS